MNDRLPPHNDDAETALIGCLLSGETEFVQAALAVTREEHFYDLRNQTVFRAVSAMAAEGVGVDLATLQVRLRSAGTLDSVGGVARLVACQDACPSPAAWFYFFETIRQKATLRKLGATCAKIGAEILQPDADADALLASAERAVLAVRGSEVRGEASMKDHVLAVTDALERDMNGNAMRGLSTGFPTLDRWTRGLKPQNLVVIAARPAVGKSALATQIAFRVALDDRKPVAIFSLEMSGPEITERAMKLRARVGDTRHMNHGEMVAMSKAGIAISKAPVFILDNGAITIGQLQADARRLHQRHGLALVVVDYIQLVHSGGKPQNRTIEVGEVSRGLKQLAKELNVPVVALSQLSRDCEKEGRAPRASDLRESGDLEADADIIVMLHTTEDEGETRTVELRIEKNRGSRRGIIHTTFNGPLTEFSERPPEVNQ